MYTLWKIPTIELQFSIGKKIFQYFKNVVLLPLASMVFDEKSVILNCFFSKGKVSFLSGYFQNILLYLLHRSWIMICFWYEILWFYFTWDSFNFLNLSVCVFHQVLEVFSHYFLEYLKVSFLFLKIVWSRSSSSFELSQQSAEFIFLFSLSSFCSSNINKLS